MRKQIPNLVLKSHLNAREKGFWDDVDISFHDQHLMLIISEISEALEALRTNHFANVDDFNNSLKQDDFVLSFEKYIKNSFQDEIADVCIRIFDFIGGFDIKIDIVQSFYEKEVETLAGTKVSSVPVLLLAMSGLIIDVKRNVWKAQYLGEVIGSCEHLMNHFNSDLITFIEMKMKYNATRPKKHNKSF